MATDWPSIDPNHPTDPTVETTIMRPGFRSCRRTIREPPYVLLTLG